MFNYFKNKEQKRKELKFSTLSEFHALMERCDYGTFEYRLFEKAIEKLKDNENPANVRKWVGELEKQWNK